MFRSSLVMFRTLNNPELSPWMVENKPSQTADLAAMLPNPEIQSWAAREPRYGLLRGQPLHHTDAHCGFHQLPHLGSTNCLQGHIGNMMKHVETCKAENDKDPAECIILQPDAT